MRACAVPLRRAPVASRPLAAQQAEMLGLEAGVAVWAAATVGTLLAGRALRQSRAPARPPPARRPLAAGVQSPSRRVFADCRFLG